VKIHTPALARCALPAAGRRPQAGAWAAAAIEIGRRPSVVAPCAGRVRGSTADCLAAFPLGRKILARCWRGSHPTTLERLHCRVKKTSRSDVRVLNTWTTAAWRPFQSRWPLCPKEPATRSSAVRGSLPARATMAWSRVHSAGCLRQLQLTLVHDPRQRVVPLRRARARRYSALPPRRRALPCAC
jgi:hypothetical protein